jgi:uncharacterized membrane protein
MVGVERDEESRVRSDVRPRDLAGARRTLIAVLLIWEIIFSPWPPRSSPVAVVVAILFFLSKRLERCNVE